MWKRQSVACCRSRVAPDGLPLNTPSIHHCTLRTSHHAAPPQTHTRTQKIHNLAHSNPPARTATSDRVREVLHLPTSPVSTAASHGCTTRVDTHLPAPRPLPSQSLRPPQPRAPPPPPCGSARHVSRPAPSSVQQQPPRQPAGPARQSAGRRVKFVCQVISRTVSTCSEHHQQYCV